MAGPRGASPGPIPRIFDRLLADKKITKDQYEDVIAEWRHHATGTGPEEALFDALKMPEADVLKMLAAFFKTRFVSTEKLSKAGIERATLELVPRKVVDKYNVVPILHDTRNATLSVVIADPENVQALEEIRLVSRVRQVVGFVARPAAIKALIAKIYQGDVSQFAALEKKRDEPVYPQMMDVFERQQAMANEAMNAAQLQRSLGRNQPPAQLDLDPGPMIIEGRDNQIAPALQPAPTPAPVVVAPPPPPPQPPPQPPPPPSPSRVPSLAPSPLPAAGGRTANYVSDRPVPTGIPSESWLETLNVLVSLLENNRPDLRGHSAHVARLTRKLCERLGLAEKDADDVVAAAYLHDLGKASSYHLTALNVAEYDGHKVAAQKSYLTPTRLMAGVKLPEATNKSLNHMYERFDGKGFPDGQSGKDIPLGARVIAITDTYADLTQNPRNPFRKILRPVEASDVLTKFKGQIFDVNLVDIFRHVVTGDDLKAKLLANRRSALIIDPDPEETTVLELRMIEQGFEVKVARSSDQAMKVLAEGEYELVVSEVDLQPLDGFALYERARQIDSVRNGTWVYMSSRADRESIDRGFELGAADYVEKPLKAEILVAKLRKLLEQQGGNRQTARGVSGSLEEMSLPDMVQILAQGRKTGSLKIRSGNEQGELHFVGGEIYNALWGKKRGEDAFYALLRLKTGDFALDPNFKADQKVIAMSAEGLLLEGMRRLDEDSRVDKMPPELAAATTHARPPGPPPRRAR